MSSKILIISRSFRPPVQSFVVTDEKAKELVDDLKGVKSKSFETFFWPTEYLGIVTQKFGARPEVYNKYGLPGHEGLDMRALSATKVFACFAGTVKRIELNENASLYGIHVRIEGIVDGDIYGITYAHLQKPVSVLKVGSIVKKGQHIAHADSTGNSTASHLHITLKKRGATASGETNYPHDIVDPTPRFPQIK